MGEVRIAIISRYKGEGNFLGRRLRVPSEKATLFYYLYFLHEYIHKKFIGLNTYDPGILHAITPQNETNHREYSGQIGKGTIINEMFLIFC